MLLQFSTTWEPVKFNAQAILTSLTGATTILIQLSPAGLIPGLMLMQLSPPTMAHSILLMQLSPTTLDHDQFSCNFQLVPTKFCNAHPCGWKVRLQCIEVRKECALQTHSRILQRTPTHSYALPHFLLLKGTHSKRTPWTSLTNQNSCTPNALLKLRVF